MKNINDTKIYIAMIIVPLFLAVILGGISSYSRYVIEPEVKKLISSETTMKEGYLLLREPQIFGGYKYWDSDGMSVKNSIRYFDNKLFNGGEIKSDEKIYLELILKRRVSGSELGIKTAFFLLIVSLTAFAAYILEKRKSI